VVTISVNHCLAGNVPNYCGPVFLCMTCSFNRAESDGFWLESSGSRSLGERRRKSRRDLTNMLIVVIVTTYPSVRVDAAVRDWIRRSCRGAGVAS